MNASEQPFLFDVRRRPRPARVRSLPQRARATGHDIAQRHASRLRDHILEQLRRAGPQTDHEVSGALNVPLASVNASRGALVKAGCVVAADVVVGPFGALRTRWRLVIER
jgi:hypothetical protein